MSLQGNKKESQVTMGKEEEKKEEEEKEGEEGEGKKEKEKERKEKEGGIDGMCAPSVLQLSADLLVLTVKEKMIGAGMTMGDVRTFRVYYQYDTLADLLTPSTLTGGRQDVQTGIPNDYGEGRGGRRRERDLDVDMDVRRIEDVLEGSLLLAARRAFGEHHNLPFILIPVEQLASPIGTRAVTDTPGRPLLTCSFLFINLLQVKSEIWIGGH